MATRPMRKWMRRRETQAWVGGLLEAQSLVALDAAQAFDKIAVRVSELEAQIARKESRS